MDILFITTQFPYPLDNGGKIGAYNGLNVVSRNNNVTCLSFTEQQEYVEKGVAYFKKKLPNVTFINPVKHSIHIRKHPLKLFQTMMYSYLNALPYLSAKFVNKEMFKLIDECFTKKWDIIFIDYLNMYIYGEYIQKNYKNYYTTFILKNHNKEFEIIKTASENTKIHVKKMILDVEWNRTKKYEEQALKKADIVFSVCEDNTKYFKKYNLNTYTMLPTFEILDRRVKNEIGNKILYIGNLSWGANMNGVEWFVQESFPKIVEKIPDVKLTIVGSGPASNPFKGNKNVSYLGYVDDLKSLYRENKVFIVPLFEGSGIRIKILEAFNNEIAVVSTSLGCETIGAKDGNEILVSDNADEFAENVIRLLQDKYLNNKITYNAKSFLASKYTIDSQAKLFSRCVGDKKNE